MKKINIAESNIAALANRLAQTDIPATVTEGPGWSNPPAVKVIDCVLSLHPANYKRHVVPRLEIFMNNRPDTKRVVDLANLMASYPTSQAFMKQELNSKSKRKARILPEVVKFTCQIVQKTPNVPEEKVLKQWAIQAKPQNHQKLKIKGFALASFQYLPMLFGANTAKPDRHVINFISDILDRKVSNAESLHLLEAASERVGRSIRDVDNSIWERGARGMGAEPAIDIQVKNTAGSEYNSEYSEFWEPIRREGLFARKPVPINELQIRKNVQGVQLFLALSNHRCYIKLSFEGKDKSENRGEIIELFPESEYNYEYKESPKFASVIFPVSDKGKKDRDDWPEIREKLVAMGTDIYDKINESDI